MGLKSIIIAVISVCALHSGAQTFTREYEALVDSADDCIKNGDWDKAEEFLIKALRREPANKSNYLLWANLGMIRSNKGNDEGALEAFDIGLALAPRSTTLLTGRASSNIALNNNTEALDDLNLALEVDSTLVKARKLRGFVLVETGRIEPALEDLDYYESHFGKDDFISHLKAKAYFVEGKPLKAIDSLKEVYELTQEPDDAVRLLTAVFFYGNPEEYESFISDMIKKFPSNGNMYLFRAMLYKSRFQTDEAENDFKLAETLGADSSLIDLIRKKEDNKNN